MDFRFQLEEYLKKLLLTSYALEDEQKFSEANKSKLETSVAEVLEEKEKSSSALEEILNDVSIREELRQEQAEASMHQVTVSKCTDEEVMKRLRELNPNIKSLDDIKGINPTSPASTQ